eukprot:gene19585-biopygen14574
MARAWPVTPGQAARGGWHLSQHLCGEMG